MAKTSRSRQAPVGKEKWSGSRAALALAAVVGAATSIYLATVHIDVNVGADLGGICNISETLNCAATAQSAFSEVLGIPVALLGLGFYLGALALALFGRSGRGDWPGSESSAGRILVVLFGFSVLYSIFLGVVSATQIGSFCPGCMILYGVNAAGLVSAWLWSGSRPDQALLAQLRSITSLPTSPAVLAFVVLFGLSVAVSHGMVDQKISDAKREARAQLAERQPSSAPVSREQLHSPNAPSRGALGAPVEIVVFSNPECPHCASLEESLNQVYREFSSALRIEYRHLVNPERAAAGLSLVCAQQHGKYFEMLDLLFADMPVRSQSDLEARIRKAGLDPAQMKACMESLEAQTRLQADLQTAQNLGVRGTPTFFINGAREVGALSPAALSDLIRKQLSRVQTSTTP